MTPAGGPVVVGVDGSAASRAATWWAATEAVLRGAKLKLLHACAFPEAELEQRRMRPHGGEDPLVDLCFQAAAEAESVAKDAEPQVDVLTELTPGLTAEVLLEASRSASTLVVGSRGTGRKLALGSVTSAVVARAHCPVVVVPGPVPSAGPVVIGVDPAADDPLTWEYAFDQASRRGAPLLALHAWHGQLPDMGLAQRLGRRLVDWSARYPGVDAEWRFLHDHDPARALVSEVAARLLVVGSHGCGRVTASAFGPTGTAALTRATCPVVVVRHLVEI